MRVIHNLIMLISFLSFVACSGGGGENQTNSESIDAVASGVDTTTASTGDSTPNGPSPPSTPPLPTSPQPGDLINSSQPAANATYPSLGQNVLPAPEPFVEPNSDYTAPIIAITSHPSAFIGQNSGRMTLEAADNIGGIGLQSFNCRIDTNSYQDCSSQVDMSGLIRRASHLHRDRHRLGEQSINRSVLHILCGSNSSDNSNHEYPTCFHKRY